MASLLLLFHLLFVFSAISPTDVQGSTAAGNHSDRGDLDTHGMTTCPPWFVPANPSESTDNSKVPCECGDKLRSQVQCNEVPLRISILSGLCMTFDETTNSTFAGVCPYSLTRSDTIGIFFTLPLNISQLNEFMCGPVNRQGLLCGRCQDGYYPAVYSYEYTCTRCSNGGYNWLLFISTTLLPTTLLFLTVMALRVNVNAPPFTVLIVFSQIGSVPDIVRLVPSVINNNTAMLLFTKLLFTCHAVWNLDFFRLFFPLFCLPGVPSTLHALTLEYLVAFYPLLLVAMTILCIKLHDHNFRPFVVVWRPFHKCLVKLRRTWDVKASVINALATFILLSYWKVMYTSFNLLSSIRLYSVSGASVGSFRFFYDASLESFHGIHLPFALVAILVTIVFVVLPPIVLCLYPFRVFDRLLRIPCVSRQAASVGAFFDLFQGYYRDRSEGKRDWRWFSGVYFLFRITVLVIRTTLPRGEAYPYLIPLCGGVTLLVAVARPYKLAVYNYLDSSVFALLTLYHYLLLFSYWENLAFARASMGPLIMLHVVGTVPLVIYTAIALQWLVRQCRLHQYFRKLFKTISGWRVSRQLSTGNNIGARVLQLEDLDLLAIHNANYQDMTSSS